MWSGTLWYITVRCRDTEYISRTKELSNVWPAWDQSSAKYSKWELEENWDKDKPQEQVIDHHTISITELNLSPPSSDQLKRISFAQHQILNNHNFLLAALCKYDYILNKHIYLYKFIHARVSPLSRTRISPCIHLNV